MSSDRLAHRQRRPVTIFWRNTRTEKHHPDEPVSEVAPAPAAAAGNDVHGACPVCRSPIFVEGGVVKGGGASEYFQELTRKAESAEEWRNKAAELEHEHTSRDIHEGERQPAADHPAIEEEAESFF